MKIQNIRKQQTSAGRVELSADIILSNRKLKRMFFSVEEEYSQFLSEDATPFVAGLILPAMTTGESIEVEGGVSEALVNQIPQIVGLWKSWGIISANNFSIIGATVTKDSTFSTQAAVLFSGGVDSSYTYFKNKELGKTISYFLTVHGFDIPLKEKALFERTKQGIMAVAEQEQIKIINIETNVREFANMYLLWDYSHGACMAAVGLALRRGINSVYFSGGMQKNHMRPYGMHPDLDGLWSTEAFSVIHFGEEVDRLEKITFLSKFPQVLQNLRVCWKNKYGQLNCGECEKCLRTMLSLYNIDALGKTPTFPKPIDPKILEKLDIPPNHIRYFRENLEGVRKRDTRLAEAIELAIYNNVNRPKIIKFYKDSRKWLGTLDHKYLQGKIYRLMTRYGIL